MNSSTHFIWEDSNFNFGYVRICDLDIPREKWLNYLQTVETDQTLHSVASDPCLHCLQITLLRVSRLQWVKALVKDTRSICTFSYVYIFSSL